MTTLIMEQIKNSQQIKDTREFNHFNKLSRHHNNSARFCEEGYYYYEERSLSKK